MTRFEVELEAAIRRTGLKAETLTRKIALELFKRVILKTPVDTGMARGNWQTSTASPLSSSIIRADRAGQTVVADMTAKVAAWNTKQAVFLSNSLPYIRKLEYGGFPISPKRGKGKTFAGFSRQAPAGMVRISVDEVKAELSQLVGGQ